MAAAVKEGRYQVPPHWPRWRKPCGVSTRSGGTCKAWAVTGMPTCKMHGSGGKKNKELGFLRYLCWIVVGGPKDMPVAHACRVSLAVFAEAVLNKNSVSTEAQRFEAARAITRMID
jgi:hypothetical protein